MNGSLARLSSVGTLALCTCGLWGASDWPTQRADPQRSGWQRDEKVLTVRNVRRLRQLWSLQLGQAPSGLTDPVILGPFITHRGIKELVFVRDASGMLYAIDADLGKIFWSRKVPTAGCQATMPALTPAKPKSPGAGDDDEFSDGNRPLYVFAGDGSLLAVRPSTGEDFAPALPVSLAGASPSSVVATDVAVYLAASSVCNDKLSRVWKIGADPSGPKAISSLVKPEPSETYVADVQPATLFNWQGREWIAELKLDGSLGIRVADARVVLPGRYKIPGGLATWQDATGSRWICVAERGRVTGFRITGEANDPQLERVWTIAAGGETSGPVIANGIVYLVSIPRPSEPKRVVLRAFQSTDGSELYMGSDPLPPAAIGGHLALANGHICLSAADTLACFGLPFQM